MIKRMIVTWAFAMSATATFAGGHAQSVDYAVGDKTFSAFVVKANNPKGNVFIVHDWNGLDAYEQKRAQMVADLGYNAIAIDLFGVDAVLEGRDDYRRETGALYQDRVEFRARISAAVEAGTAVVGEGDATLMGYCFGGAAVLEAARAGMDLDKFVSFHGGLSTPQGQDYSMTTGSVLLLHGSADPVSGMDDLAKVLDELNQAGIEHQAEVFGGARHSFTVEGSRDYDVDADRKSWDAFVRFVDNS